MSSLDELAAAAAIATPSKVVKKPTKEMSSNSRKSERVGHNVGAKQAEDFEDPDKGGIAKGSGEKVGRGAGFTRVEDVMISKAFIAASEDPEHGTNMKGKMFQAKMYEAYKMKLLEQERFDAALFASASGVALPPSDPPKQTYSRRSALSIWDRFKTTISPRVMKLIALEKMMPKISGGDEKDSYNALKEAYEKRYPKMGKFEDIYPCKEYLQDKAKYHQFCDDNYSETNNHQHPQRPHGRNKEKQIKSTKEIVHAVVKEVGLDDAAVSLNTTTSLNNFYEKAGVALDCLVMQLKHQNDMKMFEMLTPPQKRALIDLQYETMLAEAKAKKAAFEADYERIKGKKVPNTISLCNNHGDNSTLEASRCAADDLDGNI